MSGERKGSSDDGSALPPGVRWTPVGEALALLEARMAPVVGRETLPLAAAAGRVLAAEVRARRASPAAANSAVDGYALPAGARLAAGVRFRLQAGAAAAGRPWTGKLESEGAVRILTGALLPAGADTVVPQEDTETEGPALRLLRAPNAGANVRQAGENLQAGKLAVAAGARLRPQDLAQIAAAGVGKVELFRRLRVGVLSTGDELRPPDRLEQPSDVADANRPMLKALAASQGFEVRDLGIAVDRVEAVRRALDEAAETCDLVVASGGASAGDEDHLSRILAEEGRMHVWRVAMKPGRPLAMGCWRGVQVCGLPGNPVAAFVCFLIFVRPVALRLAGSAWTTPRCYRLPTARDLTKRPGRHEFLRARLRADGSLERYRSEGSGLIEGLRWSDGLISLAADVTSVSASEPVSFLPYSEFGIVS